MSVLVTDTGFAPAPADAYQDSDDWDGVSNLHLPSTAQPEDLAGKLDQISMIRIDFPSFADGRGFTIARQLRLMGYRGHLRAHGHIIADQYAMARRSGFDDVEIPDELAARQPQDQWLARAQWTAHDYQARLRG